MILTKVSEIQINQNHIYCSANCYHRDVVDMCITIEPTLTYDQTWQEWHQTIAAASRAAIAAALGVTIAEDHPVRILDGVVTELP